MTIGNKPTSVESEFIKNNNSSDINGMGQDKIFNSLQENINQFNTAPKTKSRNVLV